MAIRDFFLVIKQTKTKEANYEMIKWIIKYGANVNAVDERKQQFLQCAIDAEKYDLKVIEILIDNNAFFNYFDSRMHTPDILKLLLSKDMIDLCSTGDYNIIARMIEGSLFNDDFEVCYLLDLIYQFLMKTPMN